MHFSRFSSALWIAACASCATGSAQLRNETEKPAVDAPRPAHSQSTAPFVRNYAELVRQATQRDGNTQAPASCLTELHAQGLAFTGEVLGSVRPLPAPAIDLDAALQSSVSVNLLTPFGRYGDAAGALTFASFSYAPATAYAAVVIVTDRGAYVRGTSAVVPARNALSLDAAVQALTAMERTTVYVAAEAELPAALLGDLLQRLAQGNLPVALAVSLAPDTKLPSVSTDPAPALCPDGLQATIEAEGDLTTASLKETLQTLRERAVECLESADAAGAAGGRATLAMRVATGGAVSQACLMNEETGDARLQTCLIREALKLRFAAPQPAGSVDLELPLVLQSRKPPAPKALCTVP